MFKLGLFSFVLSIYQYGLLQSPWIKLVPALSLSLIPESRLTKASLILAGLGDFFFDIDQTWSFILGMILFSCCQITLIFESNSVRPKFVLWNHPLPTLGVLLGGGIVFLFLSHLAIPIIFYALLLLQLLVSIGSRWNSLHGTGCLLFILSDLLVLIELILKHTNQTVVPLRILPSIGLPIYWTALLMIALSHKPVVEPIGVVIG